MNAVTDETVEDEEDGAANEELDKVFHTTFPV